MNVRFVGHATVRIEIDGVRVITDPVFRSRLLHLRRHGRPPDAAAREPADLIVLSHLHLDHADLRSLRELGTETPVVAPPGSASLLGRKGISEVIELGPGEGQEIAGLKVTATEAEHEGRRIPLVGHRGESAGFVIAGSQRVYFAGDTDLFDAMADLAGGLDLALLPVWGWGTTIGVGHLDPERAAKAAEMLRPRVVIPIHWGTFFPFGVGRRHDHLLRDPPHEFAELARERLPSIDVRVLEPGESTAVSAVPRRA